MTGAEWDDSASVVPGARAIAGTFPERSGPNCFGAVMPPQAQALAGLDVADQGPRRARREVQLAEPRATPAPLHLGAAVTPRAQGSGPRG